MMQQIKNIIFIDDDIMSNMIHAKITQTLAPQVKVSSYLDSVEAFALLKQIAATDLEKFPEIIFLDLNMPETDGWDFLEELEGIRELKAKNYKVFMLTSSIDQGDIEKSESHSLLTDFISKPLTREKLEMLLSAHNTMASSTAGI